MTAHLKLLRDAALSRADMFGSHASAVGLGGGVGQGPMLGIVQAPNEG